MVRLRGPGPGWRGAAPLQVRTWVPTPAISPANSGAFAFYAMSKTMSGSAGGCARVGRASGAVRPGISSTSAFNDAGNALAPVMHGHRVALLGKRHHEAVGLLQLDVKRVTGRPRCSQPLSPFPSSGPDFWEKSMKARLVQLAHTCPGGKGLGAMSQKPCNPWPDC